MESTPRTNSESSSAPAQADGPKDFVAVNDTGGFSYHRSEQDLIEAFEYIEEAICIIDRTGTQYRLALRPDRRLILGAGLGPVDSHWLTTAWLQAVKTRAGGHRLRRLAPRTLAELLSTLFETLALERGEKTATPWTLAADGRDTHVPDLAGVDRLLAARNQLNNVRVQDPFGHIYRPVKHRKQWSEPFTATFTYYVEVHPREGPDSP